jgi:hypothetical protein
MSTRRKVEPKNRVHPAKVAKRQHRQHTHYSRSGSKTPRCGANTRRGDVVLVSSRNYVTCGNCLRSLGMDRAGHVKEAKVEAELACWRPVYRGYVAGTTYSSYPLLMAEITTGTEFEIVREPSNTHDRNAIALHVRRSGCSQAVKVGYVPRSDAPILAAMIDAGVQFRAVCFGNFPSANPTHRLGLQLYVRVHTEK